MYKFSYLLFLVSSLVFPTLVQGAANYFFQWPSNTSQCQEVTITWQATGKAPYTVWIVPVYGQPFFYDISDSYITNGTGSTEILLQLAAGVNYVVMVSDADGLGTGGSSEIQTVQPANDSSCLTWASSRSASLDFTFTVSGQAVQCQRGFELSWSGGLEYGPYNFTVIAMDQSFNPYDVTLEKGVTSQSDWVLDIPYQSRFLIMMNSAQGYGRGGTSGIYSVSDSNDTSCLKQSPQPTGVWPTTVTTGSLDPATLPITESATATSRKGSGGSGTSKGAIAGLVVGLVIAAILVGVFVYFLLKRRRQRRNQGQRIDKFGISPIDLANGDDNSIRRNGSQAMVEPYREVGAFRPPSRHGSPDQNTNSNGTDSYFSQSENRTLTSSAAGFAGLGAATINSTHDNRHDMELSLLDENHSPSSPGIAGPLPEKSLSTPTSMEQAYAQLHYSQPNAQSPTAGTGTILSTSTSQNSDISKPSQSQLSRQSQQTFPTYSPQATQGGMRIANPENPDQLPTLPPGATHSRGNVNSSNNNTGPRRRVAENAGPTFRRHADAGRFQEEIVDLPPLYSEVPRDGPIPDSTENNNNTNTR
ncbi:uncharacterized protein L201_002852 [Kwoniella dendrophila CBS 6074]|uniref:Fibronectin type-III domain-containing protein n=1 Tax=Kwoniella dendrophila CBS 6074 TaxID=1295534 RepID=A0AAX4JR95_9TREE